MKMWKLPIEKKEVKMSENPNKDQPINEVVEKSPSEQLQELLTNSLNPLCDKIEHLQSNFDGLQNELAELTSRPDEKEIEQQGLERGLERVAWGFENNDLIGELEPIAQRIFKAIRSQGYDIVPQEKQVEEAETEEIETELPEPPYLHIISAEDREKLPEEEQRKYFGWADGKVAKLVEAV